MTSGKLSKRDVTAIQKKLSKANPPAYKKEAYPLIDRFFENDVTLQSHIFMIQATYVFNHQKLFWLRYFARFRALLLDSRRTEELIEIFSYWFDESLTELREQPYVAQSFFIQLPTQLEEAKADKRFKRVVHRIREEADDKAWYPLLEAQLKIEQKKKKRFGIFG